MSENTQQNAPEAAKEQVKHGAQKLSNNPVINYLKGARREFKKVVWPTRKQAVNHTIMVIIVSIAVAIFLGTMDYLLDIGLRSVL